jgi:RHS repeat-associated protein
MQSSVQTTGAGTNRLGQLLAVLFLWVAGQGAVLAQFNGYHDVANCSALAGWAWDSSQPTTPISVDIYDGNTLIATVAAGDFRQDLLDAGIGDGNHGFSIALPSSLINGQAHTVTIKYAGTQTNLNNTPKTVSCISPGVPTPAYTGYHDVGNCSALAGWAWDANQPTTPISVDIYDGNTLITTVSASAFRQDLLNAGIGDGNHGFSIALPGSLINGQAHTVTIKYAGTQTNLNNTPKTVSCISPGVPTPAYTGYHDVGNCSALAGWAWDANQPTTPISVDIYDGNTLIATVPAGTFRQDLLNAGIGDGNHGFSIALPGSLINGQPHTVTIKFAGTQTNLNNTPKTVSCISPGVPTPAYNGYHDSATCTAIAGWAWDANQPNAPISIDIYSDNTLVATVNANQFRQDLLDAGIGNGVHSFNFTVPNSLKDNQAHSILVKFAGTQTNLNATPKSIQCVSTALSLFYIHPDHLNTPRLVADATGTTVWRWDQTEPFGVNTPDENPSGLGAFEFPLRFPGQYAAKETGLAQNWHRDYDSAIGGYKQSDPISLRGGLNTYAYVMSNPLRYVDPMGLFTGQVHEEITRDVARKSCPKLANSLPPAVSTVDTLPDSQDSKFSYMHAMCEPGTSTSQGMTINEEYIERQISTCSVPGLAKALHAGQDKHSPSHRGCRPWSGRQNMTMAQLMAHANADRGQSGGVQEAATESEFIINRFKARCPCQCE